MAQIKEIKLRIKSVKNIGQITKAMKMVASARLKKAHERILDARPYAIRIAQVMKNIVAQTGEQAHPLMTLRPEGKTALIVITADRGLCGSFNANIMRKTQAFLRENPDTVLVTIGKKGRDFFRRRQVPIHKEWLNVFPTVSYETVLEVRDEIETLFMEEEFKNVLVLFTEFKSVIQQKVALETLLPIRVEKTPSDEKDDLTGDYEFEPSVDAVLNTLVLQYLATQIYRVLLESFASEMGAKRSAMESASKNASEMISRLTLEFNRARQAMITKELAEIVGGAAALD